MEYILLQPLQTANKNLNVSLIERKYKITSDEEKLILHEADDGAYNGFVVKKLLPLQSQQSIPTTSHLMFKLTAFMRNVAKNEVQRELRTLEFGFGTNVEREQFDCSNAFFRSLFETDNFPKDYFMFLLRIMLIVKELKPISFLKVSIEKVGEPQHPNNATGMLCEVLKFNLFSISH